MKRSKKRDPNGRVKNYRIVVTAKEVTGLCQAGLREGDQMSIIVPRVDLKNTKKICVNAMSALMPFIRQFSSDSLPYNARCFVSCPDPGAARGGHGSVLFEITRQFIGYKKRI
jgi:uncharacterized repeat protein (TIGR04076 family)